MIEHEQTITKAQQKMEQKQSKASVFQTPPSKIAQLYKEIMKGLEDKKLGQKQPELFSYSAYSGS